jgi:excisionase family DNA binding protein
MVSKIYELEELAEILKVTRRTLYNCIKDGRLKANKIGKTWRVTEENLDRFINGDYDNKE